MQLSKQYIKDNHIRICEKLDVFEKRCLLIENLLTYMPTSRIIASNLKLAAENERSQFCEKETLSHKLLAKFNSIQSSEKDIGIIDLYNYFFAPIAGQEVVEKSTNDLFYKDLNWIATEIKTLDITNWLEEAELYLTLIKKSTAVTVNHSLFIQFYYNYMLYYSFPKLATIFAFDYPKKGSQLNENFKIEESLERIYNQLYKSICSYISFDDLLPIRQISFLSLFQNGFKTNIDHKTANLLPIKILQELMAIGSFIISDEESESAAITLQKQGIIILLTVDERAFACITSKEKGGYFSQNNTEMPPQIINAEEKEEKPTPKGKAYFG